MLYRLRPDAPLEWADFPGLENFRAAAEHGADFDRLNWQPTEARVFSSDLLRIALRHGVATPTGVVVSAAHTTDLGRSDELRAASMAAADAQEALRQSHGELLEHVMPGSGEASREIDRRIEETVERAVREAEEDLAEVLAAPVNPELESHWQQLGGARPA